MQKGKDIENGIGDQDLVNYVDVGCHLLLQQKHVRFRGL